MTDRAGVRRGAPWPIGTSVPRRDGPAKVSGSAEYTADLTLPGMCHARLVRSPFAHARIRSIDAGRARAYPGVLAVVTAADLADVELYYGHVVRDHPLIAHEKVRFAGEPVVAVVAEDPLVAEEAASLVEVDYEELPFVTDPAAALAAGAPVIHERAAERDRGATGRDAHPNLSWRSEHRWGDVDAAFALADVVVEGEYAYPMAYAYAMEPYVALARFRLGRLEVWSSAQHPFMVRDALARCFRLPLASVRVSVPYIGGGYGSKSYTKIEPLVAALALRTGRPVKLALSVEEAILTTRSVSARIRLRTAFDAGARMLGREATIVMDNGAYAENGPRVADRAAHRLTGPYRVPALSVEALAVYTNTAPGSSYRGLGAPQAVFASESQLDEAALRFGIDPLELRRRNLLEPGERPWADARPLDADIRDDLRLVEQAIGYREPLPRGRGRAVCVAVSDGGAEPVSTAIVRLHADGSITLMCGSAEMGQGSATVLPQIAAAELGADPDRVQLIQSDTGHTSYDRSTGASRTTTIMGLAVQRAAADVRRQLVEWAAETLGVDAGSVVSEPGGVRVGDHRHDWAEIVRGWFGGEGGEVVGRGYVRRAGATRELPVFWEIALAGVEVAVDEDTGEVRVERVVILGDVGRAVNPLLAEGQDIGGAMMALGVATREELRYGGQTLLNGNLFDYRVPRTTDLPRVISILAERGDGVGPYGARGGGEGSVNPIAPAVANALYRAVGVRLREVPLTPERVWRALKAARS